MLFHILTPIENALTAVLEFFHESAGLPWAWAIVALTVTVRMLLVPLTVRQIHSMQNLQAHAPQMKELQRKYKHDRQKLNEEMMKFYRENKINPASSCLPILFQIPIFIALYFVLRDFRDEIYEKFPESSLGWLGVVPDITANIADHWSGYVLLTIYVVSQVASTYFMATTMDRTQRTIMMILPVVFVFFIIDPPGGTVFPVGLLLYWMTTNLWTVGQGLITRRLVPKKDATPPKRSSRAPAREAPAASDGGAKAEPAPRAAAKEQPRRVKRKKRAKR
ncbi:MAG: YidC/Oxa1 family membrane protein insertase [Actinomycetota bacterium]|nr:YidC/Oxa1 family membrane protein insertase [Actinomycetota bacterium]